MKAERRYHLVFACTVFVTFVVSLIRYDGPAEGYWDTYITAPAMHMNKQLVDFRTKDGDPAYLDAELAGVLPDDLIDIREGDARAKANTRKDNQGAHVPRGFGVITKDQRLVPGVVASAEFAFFGQLGFRLLFAMTVALMIPMCVLLYREVTPGHDWAGLLGGVILTWNPYMLSVDRMNANVFVFPLMLATLLLLFRLSRQETVTWRDIVPIGLAFGTVAALRNEAVCFVPAVSYYMLFGRGKATRFSRRFAELVVVGALTVLVMLPDFAWKQWAFGNALMHPSQFNHFHGWRPTFPHRVLGDFNGLFNWPFHTEFVRTPHFGYPTYFLFFMVTARALGTMLAALSLIGLLYLWRLRRQVAITCLLWSTPVYLLFGPQENWEEVKMTFMLLAWAPLPILLSAGLSWLVNSQLNVPKRVLVWTMVTLLSMVFIKGLGTIDVPQDARWYHRFPKADKRLNPEARAGLDENERNDWTYFQSYETAEEIERERAKLTAALPWPAVYLPMSWDVDNAWSEMHQEFDERELVVLEIWGYIYGSRK